MDKNELLVMADKVNELSNSSLKKNIKGLIKTLETSQKIGWTVASYVNEIFMADNFGDDFENEGELAKWLGISLTMVSTYKTAVAFVVKHTELGNALTVDRAYRLGVIESKGEYESFTQWCEDNNIDIARLSDAKLRAAIKDWREVLADEEPVEETVEETSEEPAKPTEYAVVTYRGVKYQIPVDVLEAYKVEE